MAGQPFDTRSELWRKLFADGKTYSEFVATSPENHQKKWKDYEARIKLSTLDAAIVGGFKRQMHVLVVVGSWCGDCARQCPMFAAIEAAAPALAMRYFDNVAYPELANELRIHGASRVPTVLVASEDFFEVGRFGDRTLGAYRRKAEQELGAACDAGIVPPAADELAVQVTEWVEFFERLQLLLKLSPMLRERHND